ncbi:polysaccharide deacetylase family protein [Azospirillum canadense]|uniref:polysaccharide deacetylase family protein n=1 Tax=Azospirillum canadense TaxID=403962 RepID=UPI002227DE5C|nr:polysaccharide deacetylase family protein [Azospirillum canadense]MCW2242090.1 peptidoglycan/xylan/chitin deacetylase (PgdA/CDA1 family) [Azospirillum canadense]
MTLSRRFVLGAPVALLAARPACAATKHRSYAATHGTAPFATEHLLPGDTLDLTTVDRANPAARVIALTIDDGPDPNDLRILELLRQRNAKATFFCISGKLSAHRDVASHVAASGNEVGCHTHDHPMMTDIPPAAQLRNLETAMEEFGNIGVRPTWFRPPYGDFDETVVREAHDCGMQTVLWTIDSQDWKGLSAGAIHQRVMERLRPGAVILMHSTKPESVRALPTIVDEGMRQGFRFVTMTEWRKAMQACAVPLTLSSAANHSAIHGTRPLPR